MSGCEAKVPALRFGSYPGSWERKRLGDEVSFSKGKGYSKSDISATGMPLFLYGRLYTDYQAEVDDVDTFTQLQKGSVLSNGGEVVVPGSGETPEDIARASAILSRGIVLGGDLNILTPKDFEETYSPFLAISLSNGRTSLQIADRAQGKTVVHIHNSDLENIQVAFPSLPEQRRIGTFFRSLDALIVGREKALEKLEALKKSMLLKMFPQGDATVPEVRFKGFEGEWGVNTLDKWLVVSEEENRDGRFTAEDVLSVSGDYGVVNQIEFQGRSFAGASLSHYRVLKKGQVVYTKSPLKRAPFGIVKANLFQDGIVSALYGVYDTVGADSSFVQYYFGSLARLNNYLRPLVNKGAKNTLLISDDEAVSGVVCFPSFPEQQKIGAYFRSLDALLAARREEIGKLKQMKKALLERMFV